ncbi:MAG: hypothetical protein RL557_524 [archaeon]|jgi:hypothetical protein
MGWSEWPYWLKGGVIGVSIFLAFSIILNSLGAMIHEFGYKIECHPWSRSLTNFDRSICMNEFGKILSLIKSIMSEINNILSPFTLYKLIPLFGLQTGIYHGNGVELIFLVAVYYFFLGAFIGWLYGKIKKSS